MKKHELNRDLFTSLLEGISFGKTLSSFINISISFSIVGCDVRKIVKPIGEVFALDDIKKVS